MIHIALTGGIGSGKSVVGKIFSLLGVHVFSADELAKDLYNHPEMLEAVVKTFGKQMLSNGQLNRKALADVVFSNKESLKKLNALTHPEVMRSYSDATKDLPADSICMLETAIVFEAGLQQHFNRIIAVYAPTELCLQRVLKRDQTIADAVKNRMKQQWSPECKAEKADIVIVNDDTKLLIPQVISCYHQLKRITE